MKKLFFLTVLLFTTALSFAQSHVWVSGYTRSNGTYVPGHYRTAPNYTRNDNWTTRGNTNPYTGKAGTLPRDGYSNRANRVSYPTPSYSTPSYTTPSYTTPSYSTPSYSTPSYSTPSYSTPSYSTPSYSTPVYTGSRGGTYYINSNGNKSYISR